MRYEYPGSGLGFLVASDGFLTPKCTTRDVTSWGRMLDTSPVFRTLRWLDLVDEYPRCVDRGQITKLDT
jgi:hypothetical protein